MKYKTIPRTIEAFQPTGENMFTPEKWPQWAYDQYGKTKIFNQLRN